MMSTHDHEHDDQYAAELTDQELGLTEGSYLSEQQYSDEFDDASFSTPKSPNSETDTDSDGFGVGVDPNEFQSVEEEVKEDLLEQAIQDHQQGEFDRYSPDWNDAAQSTAVDVGLEVAGELGNASAEANVLGAYIEVINRSAEREEWNEQDDCYELQEAILTEDNDYNRSQLIDEFEDNSCKETIAPVVADFNQLEECIDESTTASEVQACLSDDYGDSNNNDIPNAVDSTTHDPIIEFEGDSSGLVESGDEARAEYYDIEGNNYFSTDAVEQNSEMDKAYCEDADELSMYEQTQLYSAEANAYMAEHTDDPQVAAQYASLAHQNLTEVPGDEVPFDLENCIQEASTVPEELDYSYDRSTVSYNENTDEEYAPDLSAIDDFHDSNFGSVGDDYDSDIEAFDDFSSIDSSGNSLDCGGAFDSGGASEFDSNDNSY